MSGGRRYNSGKPKMTLIKLSCLEPMVEVLEYGRDKYSDFDESGNRIYDARNNWDNGLAMSEVLDSLMRHIRDLQEGKVVDEESKKPIIGHIQANAMFLGSKNIIKDLSVNE